MEQEFERYVILSQSILEDPNLTPNEKLILARYSGFKGEIFESPEKTSELLGMSLITFKRHRIDLEKKGYIQCIKNDGHGKKYAINKGKLTGEVYQIDTAGVSNRHTEINNINNIKEKSINKINKDIIIKEFERLWSEYPRKQGKVSAFKAYAKAREEFPFDELNEAVVLDGIRRYKEYIKSNEVQPQYIKQGSTWFNQHCWEDVYEQQEKKSEVVW